MISVQLADEVSGECKHLAKGKVHLLAALFRSATARGHCDTITLLNQRPWNARLIPPVYINRCVIVGYQMDEVTTAPQGQHRCMQKDQRRAQQQCNWKQQDPEDKDEHISEQQSEELI